MSTLERATLVEIMKFVMTLQLRPARTNIWTWGALVAFRFLIQKLNELIRWIWLIRKGFRCSVFTINFHIFRCAIGTISWIIHGLIALIRMVCGRLCYVGWLWNCMMFLNIVAACTFDNIVMIDATLPGWIGTIETDVGSFIWIALFDELDVYIAIVLQTAMTLQRQKWEGNIGLINIYIMNCVRESAINFFFVKILWIPKYESSISRSLLVKLLYRFPTDFICYDFSTLWFVNWNTPSMNANLNGKINENSFKKRKPNSR